MQKTKIEWATHTWNPAVGCSKVSAGCNNCYAEAMVHRFPGMTGTYHEPGYPEYTVEDLDPIGWDGRAHFKPERLEEPFRLRAGKDRTHRIFVCSMSDLFHESLTNEQIAAVFGVMAATPQHQYVVLTKRLQRAVGLFSEREYTDDSPEAFRQLVADQMAFCELGSDMFRYLSDKEYHWNSPQIGDEGRVELRGYFDFYTKDLKWPLPNVTMCASIEDQESMESRWDLCYQIPAARHGISYEPAIGPINAKWLLSIFHCPDLVICGAETGPGKRPFNDEWAVNLRDHCRDASVPFFFKKDGAGKGSLRGVEYREWIGCQNEQQ